MNSFIRILILTSFIIAVGCQQKSGETHDDHETSEGVGNSDNQALYNEVMQIHDEVMPKMDELYKAKVALNTRIANTPNMAEKEKKEINDMIALLDSAGEGMMVWMRQFNPMPDSLGEEKAKEYLENELKKVNEVKEDILQALQKAEGVN